MKDTYTTDELELLQSAEKGDIPYLAKQFGRSEGAVLQRWYKLRRAEKDSEVGGDDRREWQADPKVEADGVYSDITKSFPVGSEPSKPHARVRRLYQFPWGGGVDLDHVISATVDRGMVLIQIKGGDTRYIRGPVRPDSQRIAEEIFLAMCDIENGYVYGSAAA